MAAACHHTSPDDQNNTNHVDSSQPVHQEPQEIAEILCQYSRGSYPNWMMYKNYMDYLQPDEASAVEYVAQQLKNAVAPSGRPKQLAVATFIAKHTQCYLIPEESNQMDSTNAVLFVFNQTTPKVPNVPDLKDTNHSPDEMTDAWVSSFEQAWNGEKVSRKIFIVLENHQNQYKLRSHIAKAYAKPLQQKAFWNSLENDRYEKAEDELQHICLSDRELCDSLKPYLDSAVVSNHSMVQQFIQDVEIGEVFLKVVQLAGNSSYTVAHFNLNNHGDRIWRHMVFTTDEKTPQHCVLQASQNKRGDDELTLNPGQSVEAWCALSSDTLPSIHLSYLSSI